MILNVIFSVTDVIPQIRLEFSTVRLGDFLHESGQNVLFCKVEVPQHWWWLMERLIWMQKGQDDHNRYNYVIIDAMFK